MVPRAEIGQQIERGAADVVERGVALQGRVVLVPFQDVAEVADAGGGERLDRTGRDCVDPDAGAAEVDREVAHARLERSLGHAHDVVVGRDPLGTDIGERQQAAARGHQRCGAATEVGERVTGDHQRAVEIGGAGLEVFPLELLLVGVGDGVDDEVEPAPGRGEVGEQLVQARLVGNVGRADQLGIELLGERPHTLLHDLALVSDGQHSTLHRHGPRDAPG